MIHRFIRESTTFILKAFTRNALFLTNRNFATFRCCHGLCNGRCPRDVIYSHPFTGMAHCAMQGVLYPYWERCIHIGVGFDVARSTTLGSAKASIRGTGNREIPRLLFC